MSRVSVSEVLGVAQHQFRRWRKWTGWIFHCFAGTGRPGPVYVMPIRKKLMSLPANKLHCLDNFYDLESDGFQYWRWTGPGSSFSMFISVDRSEPIRVSLEVLHSPSAINWRNTFIECDGILALCDYRAVDGKHYLDGILPVRASSSSAMMSYHIQETRRPGDGDDGRLLGLRVAALHVSRA